MMISLICGKLLMSKPKSMVRLISLMLTGPRMLNRKASSPTQTKNSPIFLATHILLKTSSIAGLLLDLWQLARPYTLEAGQQPL